MRRDGGGSRRRRAGRLRGDAVDVLVEARPADRPGREGLPVEPRPDRPEDSPRQDREATPLAPPCLEKAAITPRPRRPPILNVKEPVSGPGRVTMDPDPRIPSRGRLRPDSLPPDPRRPFAHQLEAWARLDEANAAWSAGGSFKSLVAMPTAGGKTYTMTNWLLMRVVNEGGRVVWLAQNDRLLEQAAVELRRSAARARDRTEIAFRIVSGGRCRADQIRQDDDFVLASVASLARHGGTFRRLYASRRCFAVLDEVHHAPAPSSRGLLESLPQNGRLVGLTGTPTRTDPHERPLLARLFKDGILYRAEAEVLIERGILARPIPVLVRSVIDRDVQPVRLEPAFSSTVPAIDGRRPGPHRGRRAAQCSCRAAFPGVQACLRSDRRVPQLRPAGRPAGRPHEAGRDKGRLYRRPAAGRGGQWRDPGPIPQPGRRARRAGQRADAVRGRRCAPGQDRDRGRPDG